MSGNIADIIIGVLFVLGVIILSGKGDMLIAGYNTASEEEKKKVNIKRLRLLIGGLLIIIAPLSFILNIKCSVSSEQLFAGIIVILTLIVIILSNTWAMKKNSNHE